MCLPEFRCSSWTSSEIYTLIECVFQNYYDGSSVNWDAVAKSFSLLTRKLKTDLECKDCFSSLNLSLTTLKVE